MLLLCWQSDIWRFCVCIWWLLVCWSRRIGCSGYRLRYVTFAEVSVFDFVLCHMLDRRNQPREIYKNGFSTRRYLLPTLVGLNPYQRALQSWFWTNHTLIGCACSMLMMRVRIEKCALIAKHMKAWCKSNGSIFEAGRHALKVSGFRLLVTHAYEICLESWVNRIKMKTSSN